MYIVCTLLKAIKKQRVQIVYFKVRALFKDLLPYMQVLKLAILSLERTKVGAPNDVSVLNGVTF